MYLDGFRGLQITADNECATPVHAILNYEEAVSLSLVYSLSQRSLENWIIDHC